MVTNSKENTIMRLEAIRPLLDTMRFTDGAYLSIVSDEPGVEDTVVGRFVRKGGYALDDETIVIMGMLARKHEELQLEEPRKSNPDDYAVEMELQGDRYVTLNGHLDGAERGSNVTLTLKTDKPMEDCYREFFGKDADEKNLHPLTQGKAYELVSRVADYSDLDEETTMAYFFMIEQLIHESPILEVKIGDFRINRYVEGEPVTDIELASTY